MKDYYRTIGISQTAPIEDIKKSLDSAIRLWTTRQAAPDVNARQEAEKMVADLEEAEEILLDEARKATYDQELAAWQANRGSQADSSSSSSDGVDPNDLVSEGWERIIAGNIPEALQLATSATEHNPKNPEGWALLAQARYRWGDHDDAIYEYRRAIKLAPNEASYYFDLASVYEAKNDFAEAAKNFERASTVAPHEVPYKAAVGQIYIRMGNIHQGVAILEECAKEDPENETIKYFLANGYLSTKFDGWAKDDNELFYAVSKGDVTNALERIERAENVGTTDAATLAEIAENREFVESNMKRKFNGSIMVPIAGGLLWFLVGGIGVVLAPLYYFASRTPQFALNKRVLGGEKSFDEAMSGSGVFGLIIGVILLPFMTIINLIRNYTGDNWTGEII